MAHSEAPLCSITMTSASGGWAVSNDGLLRTQDDGVSWTNVTPPGLDPAIVSHYDSVFFGLDDLHAWLVIPAADGTSTLYCTRDGGNSWSNSKLPSDLTHVSHICFCKTGGELRGWALKSYGPALGSEPVDVWRWDDQSGWHIAARGAGPQLTDGPEDGPPFTGIKTALVFRPDGEFGWIVTELRDPMSHGLYVSQDGGKHWAAVNLDLPDGGDNLPGVTIVPPRFWDGQCSIGAMAVVITTRDNANVVFMTTADGGLSWRAQSTFRANDRVSRVAIADESHWWVAVGADLYGTMDSGKTWAQLGTRDGLVDLQFHDTVNGWALVEQKEDRELIVTHDGGRHWTVASPK